MRQLGFQEADAALITGMINLGSVFGTAAGGRLTDRFGLFPLVPALFLLGGAAIAMIAAATQMAHFASLAAIAGLFVGAGSSALLAVLSLHSRPVRC